jgi:hypothetical protein
MPRFLFSALMIATVSLPRTDARAQGPKDPCSLFTKAELEAAFGYPLQPGRLDASKQLCSYNGRNNETITIAMDSAPVRADEFLQSQTMLEGKPVSGIGDAAFFFLSRLYIRVGSRSLTISAGEADEPSAKVKAALTTLGKTAVTRMK